MKLHDALHDAVEATVPDTDRLLAESRRQGGKLQRRRWVVQSGATAALVAAAVTVGYVGLLGGDSPSPQPATADSTSSAPAVLSGETAPLDGRGTVAALKAAIGEVDQGSFGGYAGQGGAGAESSPGAIETYGELEFTPADGSGVGVVGVNVQDANDFDPGFNRGCGDRSDCEVRTLDNGDYLRTYSESENDGRMLVAELFTADGDVRIVARSTNGFDLSGNDWRVTREGPVLDVGQLTAIVSQPWWGFEIPVEYAEAGADLSPYLDFDELSESVPDAPTPPSGPDSPQPSTPPDTPQPTTQPDTPEPTTQPDVPSASPSPAR